jgi:transposase-like protein
MVKRMRARTKATAREIEVRRALAEAAQCGESVDALARRLGLQVSTLRWWASQIRCRARRRGEEGVDAALAPARPAFVEVEVQAVREAPRFEAVLHGGREVRVANGFDAGELARLIDVLERTC